MSLRKNERCSIHNSLFCWRWEQLGRQREIAPPVPRIEELSPRRGRRFLLDRNEQERVTAMALVARADDPVRIHSQTRDGARPRCDRRAAGRRLRATHFGKRAERASGDHENFQPDPRARERHGRPDRGRQSVESAEGPKPERAAEQIFDEGKRIARERHEHDLADLSPDGRSRPAGRWKTSSTL